MSRLRLWPALSLSALVAVESAALAQHPLCPAPAPEDTYYVMCESPGRDQVQKFLYDFTVRHLFKGPESFEIASDTLIDVLGLRKIFDLSNPDVQAWLADRPSIQFTPLDGSTGDFISKNPKGPQTLNVSDDKAGIALQMDFPEVVQGLYWRSPAHLELQFYRGHAIRFHLSSRQGTKSEDELQCVSIAASRARATTADPQHRYLMSAFDKCP